MEGTGRFKSSAWQGGSINDAETFKVNIESTGAFRQSIIPSCQRLLDEHYGQLGEDREEEEDGEGEGRGEDGGREEKGGRGED